jgi:hypothetical protein
VTYNPSNLTNVSNGINIFGGVADWTQPASMAKANPIQQATQAVTAAAPAVAATVPATQIASTPAASATTSPATAAPIIAATVATPGAQAPGSQSSANFFGPWPTLPSNYDWSSLGISTGGPRTADSISNTAYYASNNQGGLLPGGTKASGQSHQDAETIKHASLIPNYSGDEAGGEYINGQFYMNNEYAANLQAEKAQQPSQVQEALNRGLGSKEQLNAMSLYDLNMLIWDNDHPNVPF